MFDKKVGRGQPSCFSRKARKRGISAVVATVLIILITVSAVTIIWVAIIPMISESLEFSDLDGRVSVVSSRGYTVYDASREVAIVQVKREVDDGVIDRIKIIFDIEGNSQSSSVIAPASGGTKVYYFYLSGLGVPESVGVAPIFVSGSGSEKEGSVSSVRIGKGLIEEIGGVIYAIGGDYFGDSSCLEILNYGNSVGDGVYTIDPDGYGGGDDPFMVYCDMTTEGGGWTMIASIYFDGGFFNDCSSITDYGSNCLSNCAEFSAAGGNCIDATERAIQDSEMAKLRTKYIINGTFSDVNSYNINDVVLASYSSNNFNEMMFRNDEDEFITYDLNNQVTTSMRDFYASIQNEIQLVVRFNESNTNLVISSVNPCLTLEIAMNSADNDGGPINYTFRKYNQHSPAHTGPAWDGQNNDACGYDDLVGMWSTRKLGGQNNNPSTYIMWLVR